MNRRLPLAAELLRAHPLRRKARVNCDERKNGYCESLNSTLRDEPINGEIFTTLREAEVLIESWRR